MLETNLEQNLNLDHDGQHILPFSGADMGLLLTGAPEVSCLMPIAQLTTVGRQVMELLPADPDIEFYRSLARGIMTGAHRPLQWPPLSPNDFHPVKRIALVKLVSSGTDCMAAGDVIWTVGGDPPQS